MLKYGKHIGFLTVIACVSGISLVFLNANEAKPPVAKLSYQEVEALNEQQYDALGNPIVAPPARQPVTTQSGRPNYTTSTTDENGNVRSPYDRYVDYHRAQQQKQTSAE